MQKLRTLDEIETEYFRQRPEEIEEYITILFEEYEKDGNTRALIASLKIIARVQEITEISIVSKIMGGVSQEITSEKGGLKLENVNAALHLLGYRLTPQKMMVSSHESSKLR
jgi:DNA-binding phage protein